MPSLALMAQKALAARRERRAALPVEVGPYSRIRLDVTQSGRNLTIEAFTGTSLQLEDLWLLIDETWIHAGAWQTTPLEVAGDQVLRHRSTLDLDVVDSHPARPEDGDADRTSVWMSVTSDQERPPPFATEIVRSGETLSYRVPLGRFRWMPPPPLAPTTTHGGREVHPFVNGNGHLALSLDAPVRQTMRVDVASLRIREGRLEISGSVLTRGDALTEARLVLVGRTGRYRAVGPAHLVHDAARSQRSRGAHVYTFTASHDFRVDLDGDLDADTIADPWLEAVTVTGGTAAGRVGRTPYLVRQATREGSVTAGSTTLGITPYYTFKARYPSFHLELFPTEAYRHLTSSSARVAMPWARHRPAAKPVWLIGERPYKAQDNGLHLFRYLREHHPEIDAYYVIEKDSPERRNLDGLDHVLEFRSPEHIDTILRADRLIGTHHPNFLYPTRAPGFARRMRAPKVFLQHGVMGTKWMAPNYGKKVPSFETDLFLVSSEREKEYIVQDFGYRPDEVAVTGLSRFDALFDGQTPEVPGQILVLPTWRDWLQDPDVFTTTEYFQQWRDFLTSPRLATMLREHDAHVVFCLHPNMQHFTQHFEADGVRVVHQGEVDVQRLLKESAALVTDYSSPGFDFSFLDKPVVYFQFDTQRFLGRWGSHLDLPNELPGPIAHDLDKALVLLDGVLRRGCTIEARYRTRASRFIAHRDRRNSERVVAAIRDAHRDRSLWSSLSSSELVQLGLKKARRHPAYFPVMRRLFALARMMPAREAIVFESGIGRQYSDSPRYIYEELVRRRDPRPKIWVYNRAVPVWDPGLVVVERLSPAYFWHLGRASHWVNNQNFPHYIRRRRDGVYVQTWHGTPLKRMLHDLDEIVGRDDGYVDRVSTAVAQWTTLLSPSPYATGAFRSAFRYEGDVLESGYPRNDVLCSEPAPGLLDQVRQRIQLPEGKKVVLYAPTFRDDSKGRRGFSFELPFDLERLVEELGDDVVLLLRMHVLIADRVAVPDNLRRHVIDVSHYPEIQELYLVSDVLVTDYSSVFFDYALLRRPMIFHAYDLESYRDHLRGFYLDYEAEVPGPVTTTDDELCAALRQALADDAGPWPGIEEFVARFAPHDDGHAAARVVDAALGGPGELSP